MEAGSASTQIPLTVQTDGDYIKWLTANNLMQAVIGSACAVGRTTEWNAIQAKAAGRTVQVVVVAKGFPHIAPSDKEKIGQITNVKIGHRIKPMSSCGIS